ncbi:hypothetical protein K438DRAFT_1932788 [Mycena galopus ATCC 62051]|nr:hypothetical protein K438DRAFT_1932788 [Mycena galopus ATCC 62051]
MTGGGFLPSLGRTSSADGSRWTGSAGVVGPSWAHLPTLTIGLLGVQIFWSVEMSYASPYLLSLGLTTSHVALVFLAGPLAGLVVQPLVGAYADTNTSRWGRRRPYVLGGCLISVAGMLLLGYTRAIAGLFLARGGHAHGVLTIILAILAIFVIDFSINAVQAVDRALLVDTLPPAQQPAGNACAALMLGFGSVVGFFIGNLPLRTMLPFLQAESELQALSVLVSVLLLVCHGLTAALVSERVLLKSAGARTPSLRHELREIYTHARVLPSVIRQICFIQFFAWLGWFPVAFYTTMYITDVYLQDTALSASSSANSSSLASSVLSAIPTNGTTSYPPAVRLLAALAARSPALRALTPSSHLHPRLAPDADADAPTRLGARAQLLSALLALAANALLPLVIPDPDPSADSGKSKRRGLRNSRLVGRVDLESVGLSPIDAPGVSLANGVGHSLASPTPNTSFTHKRGGRARWWAALKRLGGRIRVPDAARIPLPTLWAASHVVFAGCMFGSFFTHSVAGATLLVACTGFSWGVAQWAPFSLKGEEGGEKRCCRLDTCVLGSVDRSEQETSQAVVYAALGGEREERVRARPGGDAECTRGGMMRVSECGGKREEVRMESESSREIGVLPARACHSGGRRQALKKSERSCSQRGGESDRARRAEIARPFNVLRSREGMQMSRERRERDEKNSNDRRQKKRWSGRGERCDASGRVRDDGCVTNPTRSAGNEAEEAVAVGVTRGDASESFEASVASVPSSRALCLLVSSERPLAEAILTSPTSTSGAGTIRLADARTRSEEEEGFLIAGPGEESDSEDDTTTLHLGKRHGDPEDEHDNDDDGEDSGGELEFVRPGSARANGLGRMGALEEEEEEEGSSDGGVGVYPPRPRHQRRRSSGRSSGSGGSNGNGNGNGNGHRRGKGSRGSRGNLLLSNPLAQLSVVDVLTPREAWAEGDGRFESAIPRTDPELGMGVGLGLGLDTGSGSGRGRGRGRGDRGEGDGEGAGQGEEGGGLSAKAGVILGIHNIFIVIPQFLITGFSALIFAIFDGRPAAPGVEGGTEAGRNSVVYVFRIGGIWASIAFVLAWRLARELRKR